MPIDVKGAVCVPAAQLSKIEQCRMQLVRDISEVRLALRALGDETVGASGEAFLSLVEDRLRNIERKVDLELGQLPKWLTRNV